MTAAAVDRVGFMQGRLSPLFDGRIQAFPWSHWQMEFSLAEAIGLRLMEWTLDQEHFYENPFMNHSGRDQIHHLCGRHGLSIPSLTGDCFMQMPFWKAAGAEREALMADFIAIVESCAALGTTMIVVPLVDNGTLEDKTQEDILVNFLRAQRKLLAENGVKVLLESDFPPGELARFVSRLGSDLFGINYDIGNSAAMGFDCAEEFEVYGNRVLNVHIKDRLRNGGTVPLGEGDADFEAVFLQLAKIGYRGNYVLQTARAHDDDHAGVLSRYRSMVISWIQRFDA